MISRTTLRSASPAWIVLAGGVITLGLVGLESIPALAIVLMEGMVALAVLAAAGLAGGWVVRGLSMGQAPLAERLILGAALGIGLLSLAVLGLGTLGWLTRVTAFLLVGALAVAGLARLVLDLAEIGVFNPRKPSTDGDSPAQSAPVQAVRDPAAKTAGTETGRYRKREADSLKSAPHKGRLEARESTRDMDERGRPSSMWAWLWLLVCPFVAVMLLAACLPPGVLWREEGFGYDVLEYHLAVPKTFFEQGRITFLSNNVYSNFPLNSEMLSLLMMHLRGDPIEAAFMAVTVNVGLAGLFMAGAWLAGRRFSPRAGIVAGILAGTTPWVAYLAGIAYVEVGMLAMGMCALAAILPDRRSVGRGSGTAGMETDRHAEHREQQPEKPLSAAPLSAKAFMGGLLAGLACGFKYTAVPMVALPVSFALLAAERTWPARLRGLLLFGCGALIAFCPWMARNVAHTGNPLYPLAYSVFGDRSGAWNDELHARWQRVHTSAIAERTDVPLLARAWARTGGEWRLGLAGFLLAAVGAVRRRDRWTLALLAMLVVQIVIWLTATHLFARFAVVMLIPALVLAGRAVGNEENAESMPLPSPAPPSSRGRKRARPLERTRPQEKERKYGPRATALTAAALLVLVAGTGYNLYRLGRLYYDHTRVGGVSIDAYGRTDWFITGQWPGTQHWAAINALPAHARVMLVGEARTFYLRRPYEYAVVFNRQPLAEAFNEIQDPAARLGWLRQRGVTHLLAHWGEIARLSNTYGLPPELSDPRLYRELIGAGLKEAAVFRYDDGSKPYATLFEVPGS